MNHAAHTHLVDSAETRAADETALRYSFPRRVCPPDCHSDWRCNQGRHDLDHVPEPLGLFDFSPLEALGYAAFVVAVLLVCMFRDWLA